MRCTIQLSKSKPTVMKEQQVRTFLSFHPLHFSEGFVGMFLKKTQKKYQTAISDGLIEGYLRFR